MDNVVSAILFIVGYRLQYPYVIPLWDRLEQVLRIGVAPEEKAVIVQDQQ
jgi:hypothetical protein